MCVVCFIEICRQQFEEFVDGIRVRFHIHYQTIGAWTEHVCAHCSESVVVRVITVNIIDDQMHGRLIGINKSIEVHGRVNSQECNRCTLIAGHVLKMCAQ